MYSGLLDDSTVCIADFGFARYIDEQATLHTPCGTPSYVAPEIANMQKYSMSVDMWSIGVIMYCLLCGYPPFYAEDDNEVLELIAIGEFHFPDPDWTFISSEAKDLICHLLETDPVKRFTAEQFLSHLWTQGKRSNKNIPIEDQFSPSTTRKKNEIKNALNKAITAQRDGVVLRAASESSLSKKRKKKNKEIDLKELKLKHLSLHEDDDEDSELLNDSTSNLIFMNV